MENSTTTSVTPPKAILTSFALKDQSNGIGYDSRSVLHHPCELGHNIESEHQHLQDNPNPNHLYQYQEPLRNLRLETGLSSEPLFELNDHVYNIPLDQTNPSSFYFGSSDPIQEVSSMHTLPPNLVSRPQCISATPSVGALEAPNMFSPNKNRYESDDKFVLRDSKGVPHSFGRDCETLPCNEGTESIAAEAKDGAPGTSMEAVQVTLQLPGIETFSSPVSPSFLVSSKFPSQEPILPNIDSPKGEKMPGSYETISVDKSSLPIKDIYINSELPYPIIKEDIPFHKEEIPFLKSSNSPTSNNKKQEKKANKITPLVSGTNQNMILGNSLPQYPCTPSPTKSFPLLHPPTLPINYRPLLENLRPIRRTEEIVRLKNDGGKITIVETTDDPGRLITIL